MLKVQSRPRRSVRGSSAASDWLIGRHLPGSHWNPCGARSYLACKVSLMVTMGPVFDRLGSCRRVFIFARSSSTPRCGTISSGLKPREITL